MNHGHKFRVYTSYLNAFEDETDKKLYKYNNKVKKCF